MNRKVWIPTMLVAAMFVSTVHAQPERMALKAGEGKLAGAKLAEATATVEAIDAKTRNVSLKFDDGTVQSLLISSEVKNLEQVKVGDKVSTKFYESLTLSLNKVEGAAPALSEKATEQRAENGQLPGGVRTKEVLVVARITAIDPATKTVSLTGPGGNTVDLEVPPEVLPKIKVGDLVNANYTQALAISVTRVTK